MNALVEHKPRSITAEMASRYGMEPQPFEATVRATCMRPDKNGRVPSREEFAAFLLVARQYNLNPITKEIYAFAQKGGGIVPIVSIDGWVNLINSHPAMDGMEFVEHTDSNGDLSAITCRIYRKDRNRPVEVTEHLVECIRDTDPWKMRHRMLRHKALIQCARYAFGFSGIYDEDEAERIAGARDVTPSPRVAPPPPPPAPEIVEVFEAHETAETEPETVAPPPPPAEAPAPTPAPAVMMPRDKAAKLVARAIEDGRACLLEELEDFEDGYGQHLDQMPDDLRAQLQEAIDAAKGRLLRNTLMAG